MGDVPALRRGVRAAAHALHEAGGDAGPEGRAVVPDTPAVLQCFLGASIVSCIVLYDRFLVPVARRVTGVASGITMLQRIGTGIALSLVTLVVAAVVEMKRLRAARDAAGGLVVVDGSGTSAVPMSLWWIVPQYVLLGAADVFTIGMQEFFYDEQTVRLAVVDSR